MIAVFIVHVPSHKRIEVLRMEEGSVREIVPLRDAIGKAVNEIAKEIGVDPMRVMSDPFHNRMTLVVERNDNA